MINENPYIIENNDISVDISMLYKVSGNDEMFIKKMLQTFLQTMPETIKKIEQGINDRDWENVYRSAHFAKSSLSVIKIDELHSWVLQVEADAKNEIGLDRIPALLEKIKEKYALAEQLLHEKYMAGN